MEQLSAAAAQIATKKPKAMTIVCHSGDMDKAYAALIIASGAASMGMQVTIFCTFWGLQLLTKGGVDKAPLSRMNFGGLGKWMMGKKMAEHNVIPLDKLLQDAIDLGVRFIPCEMTMGIMGVKREDLLDGLDELCGVVTYLTAAKDADINLFI